VHPRGRTGAGQGRGSTAAAGAPVPPPHAAARLAAAVGGRAAWAPTPAAGVTAYGAAAYLAADALRARPADEAVEVSVRHTSDGGRLTVARRTAGTRTVAIEAQIA
jgi:hypothetical protein